jgi:hypothetical protein
MQFFLWIKKGIFTSLYVSFVVCAFYACASLGTPGGGAYDDDPPKFVRSNPAPNSIQFAGNKISLRFDEFISIDRPSQTVIITPPQKRAPVIRALGRGITVELRDSLIRNTTYTLDFTNGIVDLNERNPLEGFTFAFSTGDMIDSLVISGLLLNAENLEPMPNIMVGIHSDLSDTAFTTLPFLRTSQTNQAGRFWIRNVAPGTYRIFALNDLNRNFKFDQPGEAIAFDETLIVPAFEPAVRMDTIWKDSLTVDSIKEIYYTRFIPDNIFLQLFKEDFDIQYLSKVERTAPHQFVMNFNSDKGIPPTIQSLNYEGKDWYLLEQSSDKKSLTYWITDSTFIRKDTIKIEVNYPAHDTLSNLVSKTDTFNLVLRGSVAQKKDEDKIEFMTIDISPMGTIDVFQSIQFAFSDPVASVDVNKIIFEQKIDTLWEKRNVSLLQDTLNPRIFHLDYELSYGQEYQITIDSASIFSIYNRWNDSTNVKFKVRDENEYGHLYVMITGHEGPGLGQLLDGSDRVVRESVLNKGELVFENIKPGKYFLRYIDDKNGNSRWDTGNFRERRQAEQVYYYPGFFDIKRYMEWEQTWNVTELPIEKQKPLEITRNRPVVRQTRRERENQRNANTTRQSNTRISGMSPF